MADQLRCGVCGRQWPAAETELLQSCPDCGARLSAIFREAPSAVLGILPAPRETTPPSGVLAGPPNPADDALILGAPAANEYNTGDSDSSLQTTVFDFPHQPSVVFPELSVSAMSETSSSDALPPNSEVTEPAVGSVKGSTLGRATTSCSSLFGTPSPLMFKLAVSYGSAVTVACAYLAYLLFQRNPTLDLPDLAPPAKSENRVTTLLYVPPEAVIHPAQKLRLGETRQYGALRVTPLRVTRGPLQFALFDRASGETRPPSDPVLKLHLRFENVSTSQEVAPLDRHLVFTKEPDRKNFGWFKANNFVCAAAERSQYDRHVQVYDLSPESEWMIRAENLDRVLKPGEMIESFIPTTEEGWKELLGSLVWRVHLRKGYNPESLRGVTTLIEVLFDSTEIVDDHPSRCHAG